MKISRLKKNIEAILFASGEPVSLGKLQELFQISSIEIKSVIENLSEAYAKNSSIEILKLGDSYQMASGAEYEQIIQEYLQEKKRTPLSHAALEVLSIIAYNQPVTKSFVEQVRGVDSSNIVNNLLEKELLEEAGRLQLPGRPITYQTTHRFLRCFQLSSLKDLPSLEEYDKIEEIQADVLENQLKMDDINKNQK